MKRKIHFFLISLRMKYQSLHMDLSKGILHYRTLRRLKQADVADKIGIERSNYARLEKRGNKLTLEQIESIAQALEVSVFNLLLQSTEDRAIEQLSNSQKDSLISENASLQKEISILESRVADKQQIIDLLKEFKRPEDNIDLSIHQGYIDLLYTSAELQLPNLKGKERRDFLIESFINMGIKSLVENGLITRDEIEKYSIEFEKDYIPWSERKQEAYKVDIGGAKIHMFIGFNTAPEDLNPANGDKL
jgi:transcriptional regulator with XRE-family HTH domain